MTKLSELKQIAEKATPGPWVFRKGNPWCIKAGDEINGKNIIMVSNGQHDAVFLEEGRKNIHFISALNPSVVIKLLDDMARMRECLEFISDIQKQMIPVISGCDVRHRSLNDWELREEARECLESIRENWND